MSETVSRPAGLNPGEIFGATCVWLNRDPSGLNELLVLALPSARGTGRTVRVNTRTTTDFLRDTMHKMKAKGKF